MTNKRRYLAFLLIVPLLAVMTATTFTATPANALTPRDYSYLNDNHLTVLTGNTKVCGDHLCAPGEWDKLQASLNTAQLANKTGATLTTPNVSVGNYPAPSTAPPTPTVSAPTTISQLPISESNVHVQEDHSLNGGDLPITRISSVGDEAYIIDGTTPKGGHDAFSFDGSGVKEIKGHVSVDLNPEGKTGKIVATWTDPEGHNWKLEETKFAGGNELYIGEVKNGTLQTRLAADPIMVNAYMHGTTGAGPTFEPTLFNYLASWGPAEVWEDGKSLGMFQAHMMVTDGARDPVTQKITKSDGVTPYSPKTPWDSKVNHNIAELHLVFHTPPGPMTDNFPPQFKTFTHLMFYNLDPPLPVTHVLATNAYIIDGTTPKGGHDAFSFDGSGHKKLPSGSAEVDLDPEKKTGFIIAHWTDLQGNTWMLQQTKFSGGNELYVGETKNGTTQYTLAADPVMINAWMHGTTGAGPTFEPTLFNYLASWGPAEVWENGKSLGMFQTHMMVTDGARDPVTGKITKSDGVTPYSPNTPWDSKVNHNIAEMHLVFHTPAGNMTDNFPPPFKTFTHLMFYDIHVLH
ncbi:MAG: hypothetical protein KGI27_04885 [Thaumarchaeota archaeon]|nr:hypothetical protein [Nitrososphaerota archaeon]